MAIHSVLQLKLQHRRTREELVNQGIMPPLKSPAAFHEQRRSLERARTEDYLKRKIRSRPERSELVRMHILEETSAEPSLQAKQLQLKRARLADDLNDKISHRPGPMELIHKNILPVHSTLKHSLLADTDSLKGAVESSSPDEDSSDALSPDHLASLDSPPDTHGPSGSNPSPVQQSPNLPFFTASERSPPQRLTNGMATSVASRPSPGLIKQSQSKSGSDRPSQRSKKPKESKPKVKKLKYHQYIPPDQKTEREPPPQMDSSYARILQQQQLFLQLQILSQQQQQHYNYHTILPAPPKLSDQQSSSTCAPSQGRATPTSASSSSSQNGSGRQTQSPGGGAKPGALPANLDDLKVAELKHELKLRSLPVSGTKSDLIERLRSHQEHAHWAHGAGGAVSGCGASKGSSSQQPAHPFSSSLQAVGPPAATPLDSTSSSPPASPAASDRSLAGMSPDEASCNGDVFGEAVSTPLTQLSLHTSPPHPALVKEERPGTGAGPCHFSHLTTTSPTVTQPEPLDKDRMLEEKDKQIEELTRMLQQKQRLVETLRSQLERGKRGDGMSELIKPELPEETQESRFTQQPEDKQGQSLDPASQQLSKTFTNQQQTTLSSAPALPLDLLKLHPPPTLLTDSNGNHYLIALTSRTVTHSKTTGRVSVQRAQSVCKMTSQSPPHMANSGVQSEAPVKLGSVVLPVTKEQLAEQHMHTPSFACAPCSSSASPKQETLFLSEFSSSSESNGPDSPPKEITYSSLTQGTLLNSPSPATNQSVSPTAQLRENRSCSPHVDHLFDVLSRSAEISAGCKSDSGTFISSHESRTPPNSPPPSPLPFSPLAVHQPITVPPAPIPGTQSDLLLGQTRLEDFLESTTGKPLLGAEPDGPLTLIDDLHSQMLSTCSILEHPPSPMDTAELSFTHQTPGLDFGDPALDTMDWLDITMGGSGSTGGSGQVLTSIGSHTPPSVFSADFLDSSDLHLHWDSCL